ncbi:pyridoxamine 5'-phosphate oxidase family protein [Williamsia sp. CHRR-6]|uniref:pyridoxamine 5'-phosphate oxidase family protein n=1 Tax=Williamsia sp. CHRR-6 TaxID=2835871 RepID=UPI001BDABA7D|nr:TIGR03618 family F420-dependent PPOX class oxidoreductase [Williamsia sp. CHRR-6]MBT0568125.1 TIGR03618 family F420-dependent PPOX class oxidoreductase [Williamsia sp. CHRR-6]
MPRTAADLTPAALQFLTDRHLASLTTMRRDHTPHSVAVGVTYDPDRTLARVITFEGSQKVRNAERGGHAAVTQVDGPRWLTLEGPVRVSRDAADIAEAVSRYAARYRQPKENPRRVVIEIEVTRVLGSQSLFTPPAPDDEATE